MLKETISTRQWETTTGNEGDGCRGNNVGSLCQKCELERDLNRHVRGFETLLAECSSASGGNQVSVPAFTITVGKGQTGEEVYTVEVRCSKTKEQ